MIITLFDDSRQDTTGFYINKALSDLRIDFKHINPLKQAIPKGADYYLLIDDGVDYEIKGNDDKLIYWAIDTHFSPEQCIKKSKNANYIFTAQKNGIDVLPNSTWLPLGCDVAMHSANTSVKEYDVCFIGNIYVDSMEKRIKMLDVLFKEFPNFFYGKRFFREASEKYGKSKIVFNCSLSNDVNMRVFEAMCSGSLLVTDEIKDNGFDELGLKDGINCVTYKDEKEMVDKVKYYLSNDEERNKIAECGRLWSLENTYAKRVEKMLDIIGGSK